MLPFFLVLFVVLTTKEPAFAVTALPAFFFVRAAKEAFGAPNAEGAKSKERKRAVIRGAAWIFGGMASALLGVLLCRAGAAALLYAVSASLLYLTFYALAVLLSPRLSAKANRAFCALLALLPSLFFFAFAAEEAAVTPLLLLLQLVIAGVLLGVGIVKSKV